MMGAATQPKKPAKQSGGPTALALPGSPRIGAGMRRSPAPWVTPQPGSAGGKSGGGDGPAAASATKANSSSNM